MWNLTSDDMFQAENKTHASFQGESLHYRAGLKQYSEKDDTKTETIRYPKITPAYIYASVPLTDLKKWSERAPEDAASLHCSYDTVLLSCV